MGARVCPFGAGPTRIRLEFEHKVAGPRGGRRLYELLDDDANTREDRLDARST